jgi:hypothetical protein
MTWKIMIRPLAITRRRRVIAMALVYGLSLSVRFTSATGEEVQIPPATVQAAVATFGADDGTQTLYSAWSLKSIRPIAFQHGWPMSVPSAPSCAAQP